MHRLRPAQELTLFLPVALWIFSHVNGVHGALPTTRKLLFSIFFFFGCVSLRGAGTLCGKQTDCASGAETVRLLARRILGGVLKARLLKQEGGCFLSLDLQVLTHPVYLIFCWFGNFDHGLIQLNVMYLSTLCPEEVQKRFGI